MSGTAVSRLRTFPFREHSPLSDVQEREFLGAKRRRGERLQHFEHLRLAVLESRIVLPPERDPPQRA